MFLTASNRAEPMHERPVVLVTESLADEPTRWLADRADVHHVDPRDPAFDAVAARARGLVVRTYTDVNDALLARMPELRVTGRAGVGFDNVDVAACRGRGIEVVYTPDANTQAVVEFVTARLMEHFRPETPVRDVLDRDGWTRRRAAVSGRQIDGLTLGVVGLGRIGSRVARVAAALGMRVIFHDVLEIPLDTRHEAVPADPETLFRSSDVITIHVDGRPSNRACVASPLLDLMKPDVLFLNTSRGFVVDSSALAGFLRRRPEAAAVLDVHEPEPFPADYPPLACPNAHLYPHVAARTERAMTEMSWVVRDVMAVIEGRAPANPVPA